ncbi:odorant receptor 13a-like isoform X2 [Odontomachus brunneus]|uniref:odorant receptor 13a-like isoform X2 n=1 Tax=Odontomachus brunneus TaxID=486640 RepID=UPI0013F18111|nr:odorant receptor 13a-like isoform X2 [Odontomachus brunneus]
MYRDFENCRNLFTKAPSELTPRIRCNVKKNSLWPYQSQLRRRILQLLNFFLLISLFLPQLKRLYHVLGKDIDAVCMCIPPFLTIIGTILRNMVIDRFQSEIRSLLCQIKTEWDATSRREENKILKNYASKAGEFSMVIAVYFNVTICLTMAPIISPIMDIVLPRNETRMRYLGFELDYGIDQETYWFWIWLHSSTAGGFITLNVLAADAMYVTLMFHGCYMFAIVRHRLVQINHLIRKNTARAFNNHDYNKKYTQRCEERQLELQKQAIVIKQCVLSHKKAIECAQLLCHIYTWNLFIVAGVILIILSISAVQLVSKLFQWAEMAIVIMYITGELINVFFLSLMAQYIFDHSLDVHEWAYSCSWYNMHAKIQKDIILILMRSRLPCKIMAGKMFVMSLENFCKTVQTSMSYFAVLVSFR